MRFRTLLVIVLSGSVACGLFGPDLRDEYSLVTIDEQPLPATWQSISTVGGNLVEYRELDHREPNGTSPQ